MNTGTDAANIVANFMAEMTKDGLKRVLKAGSELLKLLLASLFSKIEGQLNTGQVNIKRLVRSKEELAMVDLSTSDSAMFIKKGKAMGITFAAINKGVDEQTIIFQKSEAEIVQKILEKIKDDKLKGINEPIDKSIIDEYDIANNKNVYFVDKENPYNYIKTNAQVPEKFYIVDRENPDNYIYVHKDDKNSVCAEISLNGDLKELKDAEEINKAVKEAAHHMDQPDVVYTHEERQELIDKKEDERRKTMKQVNENVKKERQGNFKSENRNKSKVREKGER